MRGEERDGGCYGVRNQAVVGSRRLGECVLQVAAVRQVCGDRFRDIYLDMILQGPIDQPGVCVVGKGGIEIRRGMWANCIPQRVDGEHFDARRKGGGYCQKKMLTKFIKVELEALQAFGILQRIASGLQLRQW